MYRDKDTKSILVTSYLDPDLDGTAGIIAYAEFLNKTGSQALPGIIGTPHEEARYVLDRFGFEYPDSVENSDDFENVILVDCSDLDSLGGKISPEKVIEIIDHRKINQTDKFCNAKVQIELVGAVVTLVAERFIQSNLTISRESAILLYSAIISNTLNFKGSVTTERDKEVYRWLSTFAKLPPDYWKDIFIAKSDLSGEKLKDRIEGDLAWFDFGGKRIGVAQIEMIGGKDLIEKRRQEILELLIKVKQEVKFDYIFLSIVDLESFSNFFVTNDKDTKTLVEKVLNVKFLDDWTERAGALMRKQIFPLLKAELER